MINNIQDLILKGFRIQPWTWGDEWLPKLQAHRGFCVEGARENTLESLAQAKNKKFEMVEIDVRLSQDEIPVLSHDRKLDRLVGLNQIFSKMTAQELKKYDFPTLEEVLKTKDRPAKINIEIKNDDRLDFRLERKILEVIRSSKKTKEVLVSSFNPLSLALFAQEMPEVPRALLIEHDILKKLNYVRLLGSLAAQPHMVNWPRQLLNQPLVEFLKANHIPVAVWTVNDYRQAHEFLSWGVNSLISDRMIPDLL